MNDCASAGENQIRGCSLSRAIGAITPQHSQHLIIFVKKSVAIPTIVMTILSLLMLKIISSVYKFESTLQLFFLISLIGCLGGVVFSVTLFRNKFISKLGKLF
ncbi:hypothetical protein ACRFBU_003040 [Enterococcus faecalis]